MHVFKYPQRVKKHPEVEKFNNSPWTRKKNTGTVS